ncbi:hypothetical protein D3C73_932850 [compost metagenome]
MLDVGALVVLGGLPSLGRGGGRGISGNRIGDREQAGVRADRAGVLLDQLHPVVVHRVVAGGDHYAASCPQVIGLEIHLFGTAQADVDHFAAGAAQARCQRILQRCAGQAHVMAKDHRAGRELRGQGHAYAAGQVFVQFFRHAATDVIGLEGGQGHRSDPLVSSAFHCSARPVWESFPSGNAT